MDLEKTEDWKVFHVVHIMAEMYGFHGTIVVSYSERQDLYRYKVHDVSGDAFIKGYGTDPSLIGLMSKITQLKGEWQKEQYSKRSSSPTL